MRRVISFILAAMLLVSMMPTVFAANATPGATTLTTNVPDSKYTLVIPADHAITFGATDTDIESITVTESQYFAEGKNLKVSVAYDALKSESVDTTIPFYLCYYYTNQGSRNSQTLRSGNSFIFEGQENNTVKAKPIVKITTNGGATQTNEVNGLYIAISSEDWGKALAGDYTGTITFTAEVVVEE